MKKASKWMGSGLVAAMLMAGHGAAEAADVTLGADVVSSYVWRGITLNSDVVVQPAMTVEHESGLALGIWSNFDIGDDDGALAERQFSEIDFDLSYTRALGFVDLTVGYIEFTFPTGVEGEGEEVTGLTADREVYVGVAAACPYMPGLALDLTVYQNLATSDGTYALLSAEYGYEVLDGLTLSLVGTAAYGAKGVTAGGKSGLHDYLIGLNAEQTVTEALTVSAFVNYVGALDSDVLPKEFIREDVFGGVGLAYAF